MATTVGEDPRDEAPAPRLGTFSRLKEAYETVAAQKYVLPPLNDVGNLTLEEQAALAEQLLNSARRHPRARASSGGGVPKLQSRSSRRSASDDGTHSSISSTPPDPAEGEVEGPVEDAEAGAEAEAGEALALITINTDDALHPVTPLRPPEEAPPPPTSHHSTALAPPIESFRSPSQTSTRARLFGSQLSLWTARMAEELEGSQPPTPSGEQQRLRPRALEGGPRHRRHAPFLSWSVGAQN
jgi:hypothetical protein